MATEEDWTSYRTAVVDMVPPTGEPFRITPAQPGTTGTWPEGVEPPVFVVTAWDPDSVPLDPGLNRSRHRRLVTELERLGVTWWPAVGRDARSAHAEEGVAVAGLDEERARAPRPAVRTGRRLRMGTRCVGGRVVHRRAPAPLRLVDGAPPG